MNLVVVDIQPEYEENVTFDIGDMLRTAAEEYDSILFLYNGEDTVGTISVSALKNYYFEKLDYDEEVFDELVRKSEFFDKGYGFFRDVMDSNICFDRVQVIKIVKYMLDNNLDDISDLNEEDIRAIGVNELLFDDLEDYGFYIPELSEILPNWNGSNLVGGARNECMAEVEILGAAQGLSFNHVDNFIYEGENLYTKDEMLIEASLRAYIRELISEKRYDPPVEQDVVHGLSFEEMRAHLSQGFGKAKITLTDSPLMLEQSHDPGKGLKPDGIWYACGTDWLDFLEMEMGGPSKEEYQVWALKIDMTKIKALTTPKEISHFSWKYRNIDRFLANSKDKVVDWTAASKDFAGIECCPYPVGDFRLEIENIWYTAFDVPSGCIWDPAAITNSILVAEKKDDGWELYV